MQGNAGLLNVLTIPPGASITSPRLVLDGVRGALFVYTSGGPVGALIGSWAGMAGTDPYGNAYPAGIDVSSGSITGSIFTGTDFILNSQGLFIYSGTPANGNLFIVLAPQAGTDSFGNGFGQGFQVRDPGTFLSVGINNATMTIFNLLNVLGSIGPQGSFGYVPFGAAGNLSASFAPVAGTDQYGNAFPAGLFTTQLTLNDLTSAPPAVSNASVLYSSVAGRLRYLSSAGADTAVQRADINVSQFTVGNTTTPGVISAPINYLGGEGSTNSEYEIEIDGVATAAASGTANTLTFGLGVDGTILGAQFTVGAVFLAVAQTYEYSIRFRLTVKSPGVTGTAILTSDGQMSRQGANAGSSTSPLVNTPVGATTGTTTKTFDTTSAHTLQVLVSWGGTNTGQTLTTVRTRLTRRE